MNRLCPRRSYVIIFIVPMAEDEENDRDYSAEESEDVEDYDEPLDPKHLLLCAVGVGEEDELDDDEL